MKFLKEVKRESDGTIFKVGDHIFSIGAGEYYIGSIYEHKRYNSGVGISGYKKLEDVYKYLDAPENAQCGFNDLNKIEHI